MPIIEDKNAEMEGVLAVARAMAVAARTAPKARGDDAIETLIVYGDELNQLADAMKSHGANSKMSEIFDRDAGSVANSQAVLLVGLKSSVVIGEFTGLTLSKSANSQCDGCIIDFYDIEQFF